MHSRSQFWGIEWQAVCQWLSCWNHGLFCSVRPVGASASPHTLRPVFGHIQAMALHLGRKQRPVDAKHAAASARLPALRRGARRIGICDEVS